MNKKRKKYNRLALSLSICMLMIWGLLGAGTSLAWFTDTSPEVKNIFHMAEFDLVVSYKTEDGTYKEITSDTAIFDDDAIYEPGYTQVVYLKIENKGTVDFQYSTAVSVTNYTTAVNVFGKEFLLQDYLRFGLVTADTEKELMDTLEARDMAKEKAVMYLNNYASEKSTLGAGKEAYMALIVRMPEEVDNQANYRGNVVPRVELGVIIKANQMNMKE
ncbi:MAG: hypothetical protein IKK03_16410 [Lachnospiraceae bacterium]|nr:hypothetical protein [Lachnospiraceae bacterium]